MSAVMTAELNATVKQTEAIISVHHHFFPLDQFLGFAGSSTVKVTSFHCSRWPSFSETTVLSSVPVDVSFRYSSRFASRDRVRVGRVRSSSA